MDAVYFSDNGWLDDPLGACRVVGDRNEGVGERGQFASDLRRIVDLCNEKIAGSDFSRKVPGKN